MTQSTMQIQIPQDLITNTIRAEVVKTIIAGGAGERWIEVIVRQALEEKDPRGYRDETKFGNAVNTMIREEAAKVVAEWLTENREKVREALKRALIAKGAKTITNLVDQITAGFVHITPNVNLTLTRDDE